MGRFFARLTITLIANAFGMLIAAALIPDFHVQLVGFIASVLFFTAVETFLGPFVMSISLRYVPQIRGGIALVTTFVGLFLASLFTQGVRIDSVTAWVMAPLVIWVVAVVGSILLPLVLFKKVLRQRKES